MHLSILLDSERNPLASSPTIRASSPKDVGGDDKWYLSPFTYSTRAAKTKKPYNPLPGEQFRCVWSSTGTGAKLNVLATQVGAIGRRRPSTQA